MLKIAPDVQYLSRDEWGADTSLPRLGQPYPPDVPTEAIQHHTVISDNDDTPLYWENVAEVIPAMRRLQTIRPDLGLDVPYSYVGFLMQYAHKPGLILCEGRGPYRRGAHTSYHNRTGRAMAVQGNTEGADIRAYATMLGHAWGWIKDEHGLVNLGTARPARAELYGHRDLAQTACPGSGAYAVLPTIKIERWQAPPEQEDDMKPYLAWDRDNQRVYLVGPWGASWITNAKDVKAFADKYGKLEVGYTASTLDSLNQKATLPA